MSTGRDGAGGGGGGCRSLTSRNITFATSMLAVCFFSSLTSCAASPLQATHNSELTARDAAWKPSAGATWNYQLTGSIDLQSANVEVWDIDLFDTTTSDIDSIHARGKHVICYFSAGSFEDWRPDASEFQSYDKGNAVEGWEGENWLQTESSNVRNIMLARLDLAKQKKCDGVDPDNVDGYDNNNGLRLTEQNAVDYVTFLADAAHSLGLAVGLKNAGSIVPRLVGRVDFSVQEECVHYNDCADFQPFVEQKKPVFHVEYPSGAPEKREAWRMNGSNRGGRGVFGRDDLADATVTNSTSPSSGDVSNTDISNGQAASNETQTSPASTADEPTSSNRSTAEVATTSQAYSAAVGSYGCAAKVAGFSSIMKNLDLDAWIQICY